MVLDRVVLLLDVRDIDGDDAAAARPRLGLLIELRLDIGIGVADGVCDDAAAGLSSSSSLFCNPPNGLLCRGIGAIAASLSAVEEDVPRSRWRFVRRLDELCFGDESSAAVDDGVVLTSFCCASVGDSVRTDGALRFFCLPVVLDGTAAVSMALTRCCCNWSNDGR